MTINKYNKPQIAEAVFDIQIRNKGILNKGLFDKFLSHFTEYSFHDNLNYIDINNMSQGTINPEIIGYRCISQDKKQIVEFRKNGFAFSRLKPYNGWDNNYKETKKLWKKYCEIMNPEGITRVATRFINQFTIPHTFVNPREYFNTYVTFSKEISSLWDHMSYKLLVSHNQGIKSNIVFNCNVQNNYNANIVFDIDVFYHNDTEPSNLDNLFTQLRKIKNEIFEKSINEKQGNL